LTGAGERELCAKHFRGGVAFGDVDETEETIMLGEKVSVRIDVHVLAEVSV